MIEIRQPKPKILSLEESKPYIEACKRLDAEPIPRYDCDVSSAMAINDIDIEVVLVDAPEEEGKLYDVEVGLEILKEMIEGEQ